MGIGPRSTVCEIPRASRAADRIGIRSPVFSQELNLPLTSVAFKPAEQAYVKEPLDIPQDARGRARIVHETPTKVEIEADMQTPGLVVLADMWDAGWHATLDGAETPVIRVDLALRGVKTPAGRHRIVFTYEPASFTTGVRLACVGLVVLACWLLLVYAVFQRS